MSPVKPDSRQTDAVKAREKTYTLAEGTGLGLKVVPCRPEAWRIKYYFTGIVRYMVFGGYPAASLAHARTLRNPG